MIDSPVERKVNATDRTGLEAYLQGALRDGTRSTLHGTHRIGQAERQWLELLSEILRILGYRSWIYREGRSRTFWIETSAPFLSMNFDASRLIGALEGIHYVRGYFDAEGGLPKRQDVRLYCQFVQKDRRSLANVRHILESWDLRCGRIHNPSRLVDPDYWRFYVRSGSHRRFVSIVGSWHPRKSRLLAARFPVARGPGNGVRNSTGS
jgi:hypothetical protein